MNIRHHRRMIMASAAAAPAGSFPAIESSASTVRNSPSVPNWGSQNMPSGIAAGELLVAIAAMDGPGTVGTFGSTATTAWTKIANSSSSKLTGLAIAYKEADGGGTDDLNFTLDASEQGAVWVLRISGAEAVATQAPEVSGNSEGTNINPNPPSLTPTGGAKDYLWIPCVAFDTDIAFVSGPAGYSSVNQAIGGTSSGTSCNWVSRELNASSEDPGTFEFAISDDWISYNLVIHPA